MKNYDIEKLNKDIDNLNRKIDKEIMFYRMSIKKINYDEFIKDERKYS